MKLLRDDEKEKADLDIIECDCGYHMGVDGTFLDQVGDFKTECPSCKRGIDTALIFPESEPEKTKVIFRKFKRGGDIIALFPELSEGGAAVESYQHIGQHSGADYNGLLRVTKPATPEEYKDLYQELECIGYNLLIRKRR